MAKCHSCNEVARTKEGYCNSWCVLDYVWSVSKAI